MKCSIIHNHHIRDVFRTIKACFTAMASIKIFSGLYRGMYTLIIHQYIVNQKKEANIVFSMSMTWKVRAVHFFHTIAIGAYRKQCMNCNNGKLMNVTDSDRELLFLDQINWGLWEEVAHYTMNFQMNPGVHRGTQRWQKSGRLHLHGLYRSDIR